MNLQKGRLIIMSKNINMFIEPIIMKRHNHDITAWFMKHKLIKIINKTSPSFKMMVQIHEFLSLLREVYMYDNNDKFHLFLATEPKHSKKNNKSLAMIYRENGFSIKFILILEDSGRNQINIEINRKGQNSNDIEQISFYDGEYEFKSIYDQEKMLYITSCLMNGVRELVEHYYKYKKL